MTRTALLRLVVLALPLAGLGGLWLSTDRASRQGTEWDIPVEGYDPRDLLQGHYVQFQYDWPGLTEQDDAVRRGQWGLCLSGAAPRLDKVTPRTENDQCPHVVRLEDSDEGRLYASEAEAARLQGQLWNRKLQGVIRIRVREDGHVTPIRLTFRPRAPGPDPEPPTR